MKSLSGTANKNELNLNTDLKNVPKGDGASIKVAGEDDETLNDAATVGFKQGNNGTRSSSRNKVLPLEKRNGKTRIQREYLDKNREKFKKIPSENND